LAVNDNIAFDTKENGSLNSPASGVITLPTGKTYKITLVFYSGFNNVSGAFRVQMYNRTESTAFGMSAQTLPVNQNQYQFGNPTLISFITTSQDTDIEARITYNINNYCNALYTIETRLIIEEYGGY